MTTPCTGRPQLLQLWKHPTGPVPQAAHVSAIAAATHGRRNSVTCTHGRRHLNHGLRRRPYAIQHSSWAVADGEPPPPPLVPPRQRTRGPPAWNAVWMSKV
eukprot:2979553-Prymnesium_polylepis.1